MSFVVCTTPELFFALKSNLKIKLSTQGNKYQQSLSNNYRFFYMQIIDLSIMTAQKILTDREWCSSKKQEKLVSQCKKYTRQVLRS